MKEGYTIFDNVAGLVVSKRFFDNLEQKLCNSSLKGYYDVFNNCRESGYVLKLYDKERELNIWACQCRNSDNIMIVTGSQDNIDNNKMFDDDAYNNAKYFNYDDYDSAVNYVYQKIKSLFPDKIFDIKHYEFQLHKPLNMIRKINEDCASLDYDDYCELATFIDKKSNYSCDLIVYDGKFGFRYSWCKDDEYENIWFEEYDVDLTDDKTLMLDMKSELEKFINKEIEKSYVNNKDMRI